PLLIREARRHFDCILVDTPPLFLPDCRLIERWVDGFVVLVTAHKTPRKMLTDALNELDPAKVLGLVFNGDDRAYTRGYGYYQYGATDATGSGARRRWWRPPQNTP